MSSARPAPLASAAPSHNSPAPEHAEPTAEVRVPKGFVRMTVSGVAPTPQGNAVLLVDDQHKRGIPIIYTTPVSRADGADVVLLPTDLSVETGVPSLTNCVEGSPDAGFPDEIAPRPEDYVYLKRRPSAFYGTGVAELLRTLKRTALVIGGGATNRGVETSVREAFSMDLDTVVVRECCWGGDAKAHAYSLDTSMKMYARVRTLEQALAMLA